MRTSPINPPDVLEVCYGDDPKARRRDAARKREGPVIQGEHRKVWDRGRGVQRPVKFAEPCSNGSSTAQDRTASRILQAHRQFPGPETPLYTWPLALLSPLNGRCMENQPTR